MARLPKVKLRVIPVFPTNVSGVNGVDVAKANGAYTVGLDVSDFHISNVPSDETTTTYAVSFGGVTTDNPDGTYSLVPYSSFQGASDDLTSLSELGTFGIVTRIADADYVTRSIAAGTGIGVTNGNGIAGNPTVAITDAELLALAGVTSAADRLFYFTGSGTGSLATFTTFGRSLVDDADAATARATLGLGTIATVSSTAGGDLAGTYPNPTLATAQPAVHTWALTQTFTVAPVFTDQTGSRTALGLGTMATVSSTAGGDLSGTFPSPTINNAPVIAKLLTGYTSGAGTISATDSILSAIQKLNGNDATNANLTGDVTSVGNATTLTNAPVIAKVLTGFTSGAGTVSAADSILSALQKINGNDALKAPLASPALTGTPTAPTATPGTNTTQLATTAYADAIAALKANIASPTFTGTPAAPTAAVDTNTTQLATTAMVLGQATAATPLVNGTAAVGISTRYARADHVHPSDTAKVSTVKKQSFTASGTYTPSAGMLYAIIECVGGGGGGGSAAGSAGNVYSGAGGSSGGYSRLFATAATIGASKTVTIGAGGNGGASGSNNGATGGDTSVGTLCIGKGGPGGLFGSVAQVPIAGAAAAAGTGDFAPPGNIGGHGVYIAIAGTLYLQPNWGANSLMGPGATPGPPVGLNAIAGLNAPANSGGGGSGGFAPAAVNAAGGNGGSGFVFITEYCSQ